MNSEDKFNSTNINLDVSVKNQKTENLLPGTRNWFLHTGTIIKNIVRKLLKPVIWFLVICGFVIVASSLIYDTYEKKKKDIASKQKVLSMTITKEKVLGEYDIESLYLNDRYMQSHIYSSSYYENDWSGRVIISNNQVVIITDDNGDKYYSKNEKKIYPIYSISTSPDPQKYNVASLATKESSLISKMGPELQYPKINFIIEDYSSYDSKYEYRLVIIIGDNRYTYKLRKSE